MKTVKRYVESRLGNALNPGAVDSRGLFRVAPISSTSSVLEPMGAQLMKGLHIVLVKLHKFDSRRLSTSNLRRTRTIDIKRTGNSVRVCSWVTHGNLQSISLLLKEWCTSAELFDGVLMMLLSA